jgi:hypothetical protein
MRVKELAGPRVNVFDWKGELFFVDVLPAHASGRAADRFKLYRLVPEPCETVYFRDMNPAKWTRVPRHEKREK